MKNLEWEIQAYGSPKAEILESITDSLTFKLSGPGMILAGYLSESQEVLEYRPYTARKYINIAKMVLMEFKLGFSNAEKAE
jgi:hypothetical protein